MSDKERPRVTRLEDPGRCCAGLRHLLHGHPQVPSRQPIQSRFPPRQQQPREDLHAVVSLGPGPPKQAADRSGTVAAGIPRVGVSVLSRLEPRELEELERDTLWCLELPALNRIPEDARPPPVDSEPA